MGGTINASSSGWRPKTLFDKGGAFSQVTTPTLPGKVVRVSADRQVDERTGASRYEARIALDTGSPALADLKLQPEMPAEVMIVTGERTALEDLLEPIVAGFGRTLREE